MKLGYVLHNYMYTQSDKYIFFISADFTWEKKVSIDNRFNTARLTV